MPHRTHKRSVKGSFSSNTETRKRCISKEQVCVLCTDSHKSYIQLAQNLRIELQQIKRGKHKKDILTLSIVNSRSGWISLMALQLNTSHIDTELKDFRNREAVLYSL